MGCHCSSEKDKKDDVATQSTNQTKYEIKASDCEKPVHLASEEANHFQVSIGDFVKGKNAQFKDDYDVKDQLGHGSYGEVVKVSHKASGMIRAAKLIKKDKLDEEEKKKLLNEVNLLTTLDHPHIMRVYEFYEDATKYYIVTEFLEGGELFDRIVDADHFSEREAAKIMKQLLSAIAYCHKHGIVHRDLKPENLMYESKKKDSLLKLIDFGTGCRVKTGERLKEMYGSSYYLAPEILKEDYDEKCDVWSCGVILFILLSGSPPFPGNNDKEILKKVKIGKFGFDDEIWGSISPYAKTLIRRLMTLVPENRPTAQEALNDEWFDKAMKKEEIDKPLARENLAKLRSLKFTSKLQEATWVFLVNYFSTKEEKEKLLNTFKVLDLDGDGQLTVDELIQGYITLMGMTPADAKDQAESIMRTLDANHSGSIDYSEFVNATINRQKILTKERLETAFKLFDKDHNGYITADEIKELFNTGATEGISDDVWKQWIKEVDENGDGGISLEEFRDMMNPLLKKF